MAANYTENHEFVKQDFTTNPLPKGEYENCRFNECNLKNVSIDEIRFINCSFDRCDLTLATLNNSSLQDVKFIGCKLLGIRFETCHSFGFAVQFEQSILDHSSFYKCRLKKTKFQNSSLKEVDFTEADLTEASFASCDLPNAVFENSNLEKADFRSATNYAIDPRINRIKKARFSMPEAVGLLYSFNIEIS